MKHNLASLTTLASSPDPAARLRALRLMRYQIDAGQPPGDYFNLARSLIGDRDNDCRWQAVIVVGESLHSNPEAVWQVVCQFGASEDEDMRDAIATVLLEHLLQHYFDDYFPRLKESIEQSSAMLADTLARCWDFGDDQPRWQEVEAIISRDKNAAGRED